MKAALRILVLLGAAGVALSLYRSSPRDVLLVYDLAGVEAPRSLQVTITKDGELVRRADFPFPASQVRHPLRLPDGRYRLDYRVDGRAGAREGVRALTITEKQTIVLSLGR